MSETSRKIESAVKKYSEKHRFDPELIRAIIKQESGRDPSAISNVGAKGLMQTFGQAPITDAIRAGKLQRRPDLGTVDGQVEAGVAYLATLRDHYGINNLNNLLTSYNGGPKQRFAKPDATASELTANAKRHGSSSFDGDQNFNYKTAIINDYISKGGSQSTTMPIISQKGAVESQSGVKSGVVIPQATSIQTSQPVQGTPSVPVSSESTSPTGSNVFTTTGINGAEGQVAIGIPTDTRETPNDNNAFGITNFGHNDNNAQEGEVLGGSNNVQAQQINGDFQGLTDQLNSFQRNQAQTTEAIAGRNAQLNSNSFDPKAVVENQQNILEETNTQAQNLIEGSQQDLERISNERRELNRAIQSRTGTDPLQFGSSVDRTSQFQKDTADRLVATERARIAVGDAKPGTPAWFRKKLFGNVFVQGAKDLEAGSNRVRTVEDNLRASAEANFQSSLRNIDDPAIVQARLKSDLQILDLGTQIEQGKATEPVKIFEAQAKLNDTLNKGDSNVLAARAQELETVKNKLDLKKSQLVFNQNQTRFGRENVRFAQQQQDRPAQARQQQLALQTQELALRKQQRQNDFEIKYAPTADIIKSKGYETALLEAEASLIEQKNRLQLLQDRALQDDLTENARNKVKLEAAKLNSEIIRTTAVAENFKNPAYVAALTKAEANQVLKDLKASSNARREAEAISESNVPEDKIKAQQSELDKLAKNTKVQRELTEVRNKTWEEDLNKEPGTLTPSLENNFKDILDLIRSNGGRADNNPYEAVQTLSQLGDLSDTPALALTASNISKQAEQVALARGLASPDKVDAIVMKQSLVEARDRPQPTLSPFDPADIGIPLSALQVSGFTADNNMSDILTDPASQGAIDSAVTLEDRINVISKALEANGITDSTSRALAVTDYFKAAVTANNNLRNYKLLGLPDQTAYNVTYKFRFPDALPFDGLLDSALNTTASLLGESTTKNLDMTNINDVQQYFIINLNAESNK